MPRQTDIADLETRIANGARYLSAHPDDAEAQALFDRLVDKHAALCARLVVVLDLPAGVTWTDRRHSRVRVLLHGEPEKDDELRRDQLAELLDSMRLVNSAMELHREAETPEAFR